MSCFAEHSRHPNAAWLALVVAATVTQPAVAQPGKTQPVADRGVAECRAARSHEAARACLERAHAARPQAAALCELGRLEEGAGKPVEAYEAFRRCLAESAGSASAEVLRQARARVADLATQLALLLVRADQPGATVSVDGRPRGAVARGPFPVKPGSHSLQVDASGCRPWRDIINPAAGEMLEVVAQLQRDTVRQREKTRHAEKTPRPSTSARDTQAAMAAEIVIPPARAERGLEAEVLLERALDAEEAGAEAGERSAAWCDLAVVDGTNPHRSRAQARCTGLAADGEARARLRVAMVAEQRNLVAYLALRRKGDGAKLAAVERFLDTFTALRGGRVYREGVLGIMAHAPRALRRQLCNRVGATSLPTVTVNVKPVNERGGLLVGRVFVDGRVLGSAPGTFAVPACADRIGFGLGDGPVIWEQPLAWGAGTAEIRAVVRRFMTSGDTVTDIAGGRTWQRHATSETHTFAAAQRYCQQLAGTGWRLPTRRELEDLVDRRWSPTIDREAFPGTLADSYWTGTTHPDQRYHAYVVSFASGEAAGRFVGQQARTRCVK
jgi:hypothetical protein